METDGDGGGDRAEYRDGDGHTAAGSSVLPTSVKEQVLCWLGKHPVVTQRILPVIFP